MNPRFTHFARTFAAGLLGLSMSSAQSASTKTPPPCNPPVIYSVNSDSAAAPSREVQLRTLCAQGDKAACECFSDSTCRTTCPPPTNPDATKPEETSTTQPMPPEPPTRNDGDGDGHKHWHPNLTGLFEAIGGAAATASTFREVDRQTSPNWVTPQRLDADGPEFPIEQLPGRFQVQGYAVAGWPFAADIYTEPGTWTWLEIRYAHSARPEYVNLTRPDGGRRTEVFNLPGQPGSLDVARYSLHSALLRRGHRPLFRPLRVYGLGAGPEAVGPITTSSWNSPGGNEEARVFLRRAVASPDARNLFKAAAQAVPDASLYLRVRAFGPSPETRPANVNWGVLAGRRFARSRIEVLRVPPNEVGRFTPVTQASIDLLRSTQANGTWGALPMMTAIERGNYSLQVRAWRIGAEGGDWTGASSEKYVYIK